MRLPWSNSSPLAGLAMSQLVLVPASSCRLSALIQEKVPDFSLGVQTFESGPGDASGVPSQDLRRGTSELSVTGILSPGLQSLNLAAVAAEAKNFPPFLHLIHHDIKYDIPEGRRAIQYSAFYSWLGKCYSDPQPCVFRVPEVPEFPRYLPNSLCSHEEMLLAGEEAGSLVTRVPSVFPGAILDARSTLSPPCRHPILPAVQPDWGHRVLGVGHLLLHRR